MPSRGYFTQANAEYGTPIGDTQYYKADINAQYYYSFARGFVLGFNFQGGYGNGLGRQALSDLQELLRGRYRFGARLRAEFARSARRHDRTTRSAARSMLVGNIELTFPLPGTGYDRTLRVFTFLDGGNVWGTGRQTASARTACATATVSVSRGSRRSARSS